MKCWIYMNRHASVTYHIVFKFQFIMLKYQHIMKKYQHTCMVIMMKYHRTLLYEYNPHKAVPHFPISKRFYNWTDIWTQDIFVRCQNVVYINKPIKNTGKFWNKQFRVYSKQNRKMLSTRFVTVFIFTFDFPNHINFAD